MDRLESFIRENRDGFDDRHPDPRLWARIAAQLPASQYDGSRQILMWKWIAAAAVVVALVMSGVVAGIYMGQGSLGSDPAYAEFLQTQQYYSVEFNKKKSELSRYAYDPQVDKDLQELERVYQELSLELTQADQPNKQELINAMIMVYQSRIELLERVLRKTEQENSAKPTMSEDEKVKI